MSIRSRGVNYVKGYVPGGRQVSKHVELAEKALGKRLPPGAVVHHIDEDPRNNDPSNLVVCPNEAYHKLLHTRMKAFEACGNYNWQKCQYCGEWDAPESMQSIRKNDRPSTTFWHGVCRSAYRKAFKKRNGYHV